MATSKLQEETKKRLRLLLGNQHFEENYRPDWLTNPQSGLPLELDFWLPEAQAGIEVQGLQHIRYTSRFHQSPYDFQQQLERDRTKRELCAKNGIALYEVFGPKDIDEFIDQIAIRDEQVGQDLANRRMTIRAMAYYRAQLHILSKQKTHRKKWAKHQKRQQIISLMARLTSLAEKHNIPINLVEPDFSIKTAEMVAIGKPVIQILRFKYGRISKYIHAAIVNIDGCMANVTWLNKKVKGGQVHMIFNLVTGYSEPRSPNPLSEWRINFNTLPKSLVVFSERKLP